MSQSPHISSMTVRLHVPTPPRGAWDAPLDQNAYTKLVWLWHLMRVFYSFSSCSIDFHWIMKIQQKMSWIPKKKKKGTTARRGQMQIR